MRRNELDVHPELREHNRLCAPSAAARQFGPEDPGHQRRRAVGADRPHRRSDLEQPAQQVDALGRLCDLHIAKRGVQLRRFEGMQLARQLFRQQSPGSSTLPLVEYSSPWLMQNEPLDAELSP